MGVDDFVALHNRSKKLARVALAVGLSDPPLGQAREEVGIRSKSFFPWSPLKFLFCC
jgi:hypothetical protein